MSGTVLLIVAAAGLLIAGLAATAAQVLQDYSRHELEKYCQKRNQFSRFGQILDGDEQVLIGVACLRVVGGVLLTLGGGLWYFHLLVGLERVPPLQFAAGAAMAILVLVAAMIWIPWAVVCLWATPFLYHSWSLLRFATGLVWPLTLGVNMLNALLRRLAGRPERAEDEEEAFEEEIRSIVTEGLHDGLLEEDAMEMIEGVMELGDAVVSDIMSPRSNIDACNADLSWPDIQRFVVEAGRTRVPVYDKNLDNIIGILYVKDMLRELTQNTNEPRAPLRKMLRKPWLVPTTKPLDDMLQEFQQTRNHLAIVVDEYQSVAGVVTIEDVLEEIVGEIVDESDKEEDELIQPVNETTFDVIGTAHIDVVNDRLGIELPDPDDCDTVAGLLIRKLGRIPKTSDTLLIDGVRLTVLDASRRRIGRLRIERPPQQTHIPRARATAESSNPK